MKESQKKAFDFASESTKLLITLSTGIIALTITFSKDFVDNASSIPIWSLIAAWGFFFLSIISGVFTMLSLTGVLMPKKADLSQIDDYEKKLSINEPSVTAKSITQIFSFLLALVFTCIFGYQSLTSEIPKEKEKIVHNCKHDGRK